MATPMITNLKKLGSSNSNLVDPSSYRQLISSLMYLLFSEHPTKYMFYCKHSRPISNGAQDDHCIAVKHILIYLHGTIHHFLRYVARNEIQLLGYIDFD